MEREVTVLTLIPDNPCNTTITSPSGDEVYSVVTEQTRKATFTTVRDVGDEIIGSLEWREVLPDKVTVGANRPVSMTDWIKKSKIPFKDHASFTDGSGRKYRWRGLAPGMSPELCTEDDNYTASIARFTRSRRVRSPLNGIGASASPHRQPGADPAASLLSLSPTLTDTQSLSPTLADNSSLAPSLLGPGTLRERSVIPATLSLLPRAVEIQDLVVMTFLFLEKSRRSRDRSGYSGEGMSFGNSVPMSAC